MVTFALQEIRSVSGKQIFYKLLKKNVCFFDEFEKEVLQSQYASEIPAVYLYMERVANGDSMPASKFKDITPSQETVKESLLSG